MLFFRISPVRCLWGEISAGFLVSDVLLSTGFLEAREDPPSESGVGREGAARGPFALGRVGEAVGFVLVCCGSQPGQGQRRCS